MVEGKISVDPNITEVTAGKWGKGEDPAVEAPKEGDITPQDVVTTMETLAKLQQMDTEQPPVVLKKVTGNDRLSGEDLPGGVVQKSESTVPITIKGKRT